MEIAAFVAFAALVLVWGFAPNVKEKKEASAVSPAQREALA